MNPEWKISKIPLKTIFKWRLPNTHVHSIYFWKYNEISVFSLLFLNQINENNTNFHLFHIEESKFNRCRVIFSQVFQSRSNMGKGKIDFDLLYGLISMGRKAKDTESLCCMSFHMFNPTQKKTKINSKADIKFSKVLHIRVFKHFCGHLHIIFSFPSNNVTIKFQIKNPEYVDDVFIRVSIFIIFFHDFAFFGPFISTKKEYLSIDNSTYFYCDCLWITKKAKVPISHLFISSVFWCQWNHAWIIDGLLIISTVKTYPQVNKR